MCQNMSGLSTADSGISEKAGLSNECVDSSTKTVAQILRSNVVTYYNLIFDHYDPSDRGIFGILLFTYYYCKYVDRDHPGAAFQKRFWMILRY